MNQSAPFCVTSPNVGPNKVLILTCADALQTDWSRSI